MDKRNEQGKEEKEANEICFVVAVAHPDVYELPTEECEACKHEAHHYKLQTSRSDEQIADRLILSADGNHGSDFRKQHSGNRSGERHVHLLQLNGYSIDRYDFRPAINSQNALSETPIYLIHYRIEEYPERIETNLFQKGEIELGKDELYMQLAFTIIIIGTKRKHIEDCLQHDHGNSLVTVEKEDYHHHRVEYNPYQVNRFLEHEPFIRHNDRPIHVHYESETEVEYHQSHHQAYLMQLLRIHAAMEEIVRVEIKNRSRNKHHQSRETENQEEHSEHFLQLLLFVPCFQLGCISYQCIAEAEIQNRKTAHHRGD